MDMKYTPGPWKRNHLTVKDQRGMVIAEVKPPHHMLKGRERNEDMEWCIGNANAISAIPDLLEATAAAMQCIGELSPTQARVEVMQMLEAALSKAKGA
ncbi:hypothetical protein [Ralstonia pickettii]|uniref:hypothetical protein n=1 Tax=Ralstonia pickettii TaxID=329 RepID=UPI0015F7A108|nr:hypothetical protein [Ralstonia pickettii]MBB0023662.1 hypothetical protein [Ralstonia pickettii]MBB0096979.1 hypothetical protein [Ralstonia pickettii]MBB0107051.1 hypothetical protein [Ralstonia pickettii]MBB0127752.1 hypothetical protein [Ralstonia pickettii]MBB0160751.1 hypothetical protein [Ralstonia pickettii]